MLTKEKNTPKQQEYIQLHLAMLKGMIGELVASRRLLTSRLKKFPLQMKIINREITHIEERINAIMISVHFIEEWPDNLFS